MHPAQPHLKGSGPSRPRFIVSLLLAVFAIPSLFAAGDREVVDLYSTDPHLDVTAVAVIQNSTGLGGGLDLVLEDPDAWQIRAQASYGLSLFGEGGTVDAELDYALGMDGGKARLGFSWVYSARKTMRTYFKKVLLVSSSGNSELWRGYNYRAPFYSGSSLGLEVLLENSGVYVPGLSESVPLTEVWYTRPGYSLYVRPNLGWTFGDNFRLKDSLTGDVNERFNVSLSLGALLCPDLTQYGGDFEALMDLGFGTSPVDLRLGVMFGLVLRNEVPDSAGIAGRDEAGSGAIDGIYIPFRVDVGIHMALGGGKTEAGK